jgi:hypothetical protein
MAHTPLFSSIRSIYRDLLQSRRPLLAGLKSRQGLDEDLPQPLRETQPLVVLALPPVAADAALVRVREFTFTTSAPSSLAVRAA